MHMHMYAYVRTYNIDGDNLDKLNSLDFATIEQASVTALRQTAEEFKVPAPLSDDYAMEWAPVVDGNYLPSNPVTPSGFASAAQGKDLLIGSNLNEWTRMMGGDQGTLSQQEQDAYARTYPDKDASSANKVDTLIRVPLLKIMTSKAGQNDGKVFAYVFAQDSGMRGAYHGAEIPYVFQHRENDRQLMQQMGALWASFAKTGTPSSQGVPQWKPYTRDGGATMILDHTSRLAYHHDEQLMHLLKPNETW